MRSFEVEHKSFKTTKQNSKKILLKVRNSKFPKNPSKRGKFSFPNGTILIR